MLSRCARLFVACATALVAWLVAAPAYASAPLCDPRGATAIAPAPQLQQPLTSIDVGTPGDDGCREYAVTVRTVNDGRAPAPASPSTSFDSAVPSTTPLVLASPCASRRAAWDAREGERPGEQSRVDRPPRA